MVFNNLAKLVTLVALGVVSAKEHFIVQAPMKNEHALVQATGNICELCFFNDAVEYKNDSKNKMCMTMSGS